MWLQHTEDPSQGHRQHHSLHHYLLIFKAGEARGRGGEKGGRSYLRDFSYNAEEDG